MYIYTRTSLPKELGFTQKKINLIRNRKATIRADEQILSLYQ